jgi:hypothetical protein
MHPTSSSVVLLHIEQVVVLEEQRMSMMSMMSEAFSFCSGFVSCNPEPLVSQQVIVHE